MAQETLDRRLSAVERRTGKLETKLSEIETGFGEALYRNRLDLIELKIANRRMMALMGAAPVTQDEVYAVLEEEA